MPLMGKSSQCPDPPLLRCLRSQFAFFSSRHPGFVAAARSPFFAFAAPLLLIFSLSFLYQCFHFLSVFPSPLISSAITLLLSGSFGERKGRKGRGREK